jgi:hypothetical protein
MAFNIDGEVAQMKRMSVGELQQKFADVCGEQPLSRNKQWLIKRLAWKHQAREYGGLSELALRRAAEIADTCDLSDLRLTAPRESIGTTSVATPGILPCAVDKRLPMPGTVLTRNYKGRTICVKVLGDAFEFEGERFKSLSAVAKQITGAHWNGFHFFGLNKKEASA